MTEVTELAEGTIEGIEKDSMLVRVALNNKTRAMIKKNEKTRSLLRVMVIVEGEADAGKFEGTRTGRRRSSFDAKKLLSGVKRGKGKSELVDFGPAVGKELD